MYLYFFLIYSIADILFPELLLICTCSCPDLLQTYTIIHATFLDNYFFNPFPYHFIATDPLFSKILFLVFPLPDFLSPAFQFLFLYPCLLFSSSLSYAFLFMYPFIVLFLYPCTSILIFLFLFPLPPVFSFPVPLPPVFLLLYPYFLFSSHWILTSCFPLPVPCILVFCFVYYHLLY